jgi:hypothetical protein
LRQEEGVVVESIIDSLISIEKRAQELNGKAKKDLNNLNAIIADRKKLILENIETKTAKDIQAIKVETDESISAEKGRIKEEKNTLLSEMMTEYKTSHEQWEGEIFKSIIS